MAFEELSDNEERIGKAIVNAAYQVHSQLGPGLLEKVYEVCLTHELRKVDMLVARQVDIPINMMEFNLMKVYGLTYWLKIK
ncbi:MAG: GxxExxY protein [Cyclobacteriaceae bacterium]